MEENWLTEELIQNTFLYCMKRLHNTSEAEDLAQDILTEALMSYRCRQEQITAVYAWFWKLAHHRYCLYLRKKRNGAVSLEEVGGSLPADILDPAEGIVAEEELSALAEEIPIGRFGSPEEVADFALQIAKGHSYLTGQIIQLDGGWY